MTKKDPNSASADDNEDLDALRKRVNELEQAADTAEQGDDGITKRGFVKAAWAAPVIMSVNLPNAVFAQSTVSPVSTPAPTSSPGATPAPTRARRTRAPGRTPSATPAPSTFAPSTFSPAAI